MDRSRQRFPSDAGAGADVGPMQGGGLAGAVAGSALLRARPADVPALRRRPGPVPEGWSRTPPSLLRYSDEQTVAGTAAVFEAMAAMGAGPEAFEGWGVVVASRYLGRASLAVALRSFGAEGVWGTSPHLIPHFALHSPSGTVSLALGVRGPNVGAGGGLHAATEGFLAALTWLAAGVVPGVWLVLSGWSPELIPDREAVASRRSGAPSTAARPDEPECRALALALRPVDVDGNSNSNGNGGRSVAAGPTFRVRIDDEPGREAVAEPVDLVRLAGELKAPSDRAGRTVATDPAGRVRVELSGVPAGAGC